MIAFSVKHWMERAAYRRVRGRMERQPRNMFDMEHATVVDTSTTSQMIQQFMANSKEDVFSGNLNITVSAVAPVEDILLKLKGFISSGRINMMDRTNTYITGDWWDEPVMISVFDKFRGDDESRRDVHSLNVSFYGSLDAVKALKELTKLSFAKERLAKVKWWYEGRHGPDTKDVYLDNKRSQVLHPEFYPDLVAKYGSPDKFFDAYLASDSSVLLLAGPPGTGKTTLLRNMIMSRKLGAHVIYEEKLMEKDNVFQHFLFDYDDGEILVIEDADTMLTSRERDGNPLMARFLSVSDGLVKLPNKKLVFTTNISDYRRVDEALIRPGRCFDGVNTRALTYVEAELAAKAAGLKVPYKVREYTIAELFNQDYTPEIRQVGFGVR